MIDQHLNRIEFHGRPRPARISIPWFDASQLTDTAQHDAFARAVRRYSSLLLFHHQDGRLSEREHRLVRTVFKRGHDRGPAIEIFEARGMLAIDPRLLEPADRMTFTWTFERIYYANRSR